VRRRPVVAGLVLAATLLVAGPARAHDGGDYGNGNDQRRCHRSEGDCRGSFSPGPFDRSPVDVHDNTVCFPFASCGQKDGDGKMGGDDRPPGDGA
jgi:hypothetical protein